MEREQIVLNEERNVTLTAYIQKVGGKFKNIVKRPAILILPGGRYEYCSEREGDPVAFAYLKAGYQVFILNYSVGEYNTWPNPLEDVEMAMEMIRGRKEWNIYTDKFAVIGFSAGGHLAAAAATMSKNRPNAAILGYAIAGSDVKICNGTAPDTIPYVDANTCPCFVFATRTDNVVLIQNSIDFIHALNQANVSFESHIYAFGPHGFSTADSSIRYPDIPLCERAEAWVEDSISWLKDMFGDFENGVMTEPTCGPHNTGDNDEFLSADCTIGHIMDCLEGKKIPGEMAAFLEKQPAADVIRKMVLGGGLRFLGVPEKVIEKIDRHLRRIPNQKR